MKHIRSAWQHMRRTPYQTLAAIIITSLTFFVATFITILALFSSSLLGYYERQPQITIYFDDTKVEKDIISLKSELEIRENVELVKYISKSDALKIYQEANKEDPLLLEMVTEDILPASLEIRTTDVDFLDNIATAMKDEPGVEDVAYQKDFVDKLVAWTKSIRALGLIILSVLMLETVLIILTIIGMRIVIKRKEIKILQLIGASSWYIRSPFIVEGIIYGLLGTIFGWILNYGLLIYQRPFLASLLGGVNILTISFLPQFEVWPISLTLMLALLGVTSLLGILLGTIGSLFAVHRYLK